MLIRVTRLHSVKITSKMSFCRSSKLRSGKNISVTFTSDEDTTDLDDLPILELIGNERQEETIDMLTLLEMEDAREELGKSFLDLPQVCRFYRTHVYRYLFRSTENRYISQHFKVVFYELNKTLVFFIAEI
jgi:hypothetical protein